MSLQLIGLVIAALSVPLLATAQDPPPAPTATAPEPPGCALHPAPECRYFGVTDFGAAFGPRVKTRYYFDQAERRQEMFVEGGVMRNVGSDNAFGITWFLAFDNDGGSTGPGVRYRHWLTTRQSLDAGLAVPVASSYDNGTLFGLIRYSPAPWIGLSVRPERIRHTTFDCVAFPCGFRPDNRFRVLVGGDVSGKPGAVVMAGYGIAASVLILLLVVAYHGD